jgi:hypothetical protein
MQKGIPPHLDSIIVIYFTPFGKGKEHPPDIQKENPDYSRFSLIAFQL